MALGWPIKPKMWKLNNVPLECSSICIDEQKTLKNHILSIKIQPALSAYIIQRKFQKIQRKISKVSILKFWGIKLIQKLFNGIGLHSWGPDASFNTHIAISSYDIWCMPYASFMSKMSKMPYLTSMPFDTCHAKWQYGYQKMRQGLRPNAIKQLLNRFFDLKYQNNDFWNFPLYFFQISFV